MTNGLAILLGGNVDKLHSGQDTENYSYKWLKQEHYLKFDLVVEFSTHLSACHYLGNVTSRFKVTENTCIVEIASNLLV